MRILIAEDDVTSRAVLAAVLTRSGDDRVETVDGEHFKPEVSATARG